MQVKEKSVVLQLPDKSIVEVPCGMVVWAAVRFFRLHKVIAHIVISYVRCTGQQGEKSYTRSDGKAAFCPDQQTRDHRGWYVYIFSN